MGECANPAVLAPPSRRAGAIGVCPQASSRGVPVGCVALPTLGPLVLRESRPLRSFESRLGARARGRSRVPAVRQGPGRASSALFRHVALWRPPNRACRCGARPSWAQGCALHLRRRRPSTAVLVRTFRCARGAASTVETACPLRAAPALRSTTAWRMAGGVIDPWALFSTLAHSAVLQGPCASCLSPALRGW